MTSVDESDVSKTTPQGGSPLEGVDLALIDRLFAGIPDGPWNALKYLEGWEVRQVDTDPSNKHHWPFRLCESISGQRAACDEATFGFIAAILNTWPTIRAALSGQTQVAGDKSRDELNNSCDALKTPETEARERLEATLGDAEDFPNTTVRVSKTDLRSVLSEPVGEGSKDGWRDLHPTTADLVRRFADALAGKLRGAEDRYGYRDGWRTDDWREECQRQLGLHVAKGDPLDVAAYAAFCWARGWNTTEAWGHTPALKQVFEEWCSSMCIGAPDAEIFWSELEKAQVSAKPEGEAGVGEDLSATVEKMFVGNLATTVENRRLREAGIAVENAFDGWAPSTAKQANALTRLRAALTEER